MEEEKPTVYFYCDSGDFVHCNSCDKIMLLPTGADKCPACHREGALSWEDLNLQEATREELSALEKYELIVETAPEPSEYLSGEVMWEKTVEIIQANRPCNDYELELYKAEFANRPFPLKSVEELFYDFDAWQKQSGLVIEKITDANYWASI